MPRLKNDTCQFIIIYFCLLSETDILLETHHEWMWAIQQWTSLPSSIFQTDWTNSFLWEKRTDLSLNAERLCVSALLNVLTNARTETLRDCPTWRCFHSIIDSVWAPAYTTSENLKRQQSPVNMKRFQKAPIELHRFQKFFHAYENANPPFSNSSDLKSVSENLSCRDGLEWTVGVTSNFSGVIGGW